MKPDLVSGSPLWQTVFVSFALLLLLLQVLRGWQLGLPRQLVRVVALVAAYSTALFGGKAALPFLRPLLQVPDFILSALGGAILAMIVYSLINTIGAILFKRTAQQAAGPVRLAWGVSGAALGFLFGLFFIWLTIVGIRTVGAVAEAQVNARAPGRIAAFTERPLQPRAQARRTATEVPDQNSLPFTLARLKKSIELGTVGEVVKQSDVIPAGVYETLGHVGEVFAKPERAARFLSYPGVIELTENPKILALRADPEITRMLEQGKLWELMQDQRLIEAANDPELAAQIKRFDLKKALDYAAKEE
ncbi:MAG TPA: CvpA family protein [Chthoniobacterales bacterium]|nr:CvpA family protein [Chthoniobacterales bacterium]